MTHPTVHLLTDAAQRWRSTRKPKPRYPYRTFTEAEVRAVVSGQEYLFLGLDGQARRLRVTSVKTWKRQPERLELHLKHGLYDHGVWDLEEAKRRLLHQLCCDACGVVDDTVHYDPHRVEDVLRCAVCAASDLEDGIAELERRKEGDV